MNILEEIKAIWERQNIHRPNDLQAHIYMDEPDIFMANAVEWLMEKQGDWVIAVQFDPVYHDVYQIDVIALGNGIARYRWVNPKYLERYHQNKFEYQVRDEHIKEINTDYSPDKILNHASDAVNGTMLNNNDKEEWYETIELDMTDAEIALIARAAHAQDITINEFMNNVIKAELDSVMPEWREEMKKSV